MSKSPDAFRTISEVAEQLDVATHVLRFWETKFPQLRPVKGAGGRRYYRRGDIAMLAGVKHLLHEQGMTIRGVQKILREQGVRYVAAVMEDVTPSENIELPPALAQTTDLAVTPALAEPLEVMASAHAPERSAAEPPLAPEGQPEPAATVIDGVPLPTEAPQEALVRTFDAQPDLTAEPQLDDAPISELISAVTALIEAEMAAQTHHIDSPQNESHEQNLTSDLRNPRLARALRQLPRLQPLYHRMIALRQDMQLAAAPPL